MNGEQLKNVINNWIVENKHDEHDVWFEPDYWLGEPTQMSANVVTVEVVDWQSGGENVFGGGVGDIWIVFKVTTDGVVQFFKRSGSYRSYIGSEWQDGLTEVFPQERKVTYYE